jgi:hypothetical protein
VDGVACCTALGHPARWQVEVGAYVLVDDAAV